MAEKKKITNIDDFFKDLQGKHYDAIGKAFKEYDDFNKDENTEALLNDVFNPAHDDMYQAIVKQLDTTFGDDKAKVHNKDKELKKAATEGMKKYFEKAQPSVLKAIEGLKDDEAYEVLAHHYNESVGHDPRNPRNTGTSIQSMIEAFAKDKDATVGKIKSQLYGVKSEQSAYAIGKLGNHIVQHHFSKYQPAEIAAHIKPKLEKAGVEMYDPTKAATLGLGDLIQLYAGHKKGEVKGGYKQYGFKKKKEEEPKEYKKAA